MKSFYKKVFTFLVVVLVSVASFSHSKYAYTTKIIAIVGDNVITDIDADDFTAIFCSIQNIKPCNKQNIYPMAVMSLVETQIKAEHMSKLGIKDNEFHKGYGEYKKSVLKQIRLGNNINQEQFNWFLFTEYKWNAIVSSMIGDAKITNEEIKDFKEKNKNLKLSNEQVKNILFNKKVDDKSRSLINEARKYYLVDIKI